MYFAKVTCLDGNVLITKQVKIALAYDCTNSLDNKKLVEYVLFLTTPTHIFIKVQYVHLNRNHNYMRIVSMGEALNKWM